HFSAVKIVADVASSIPNPSIDAVIAVKSPTATPATVAMPERRRPWPSAYDTTSRVVGPGIASRIAEAVTNASHIVTDTQISLVKAHRLRHIGNPNAIVHRPEMVRRTPRLLYPQKRTCAAQEPMSAKGQKRTYAVKGTEPMWVLDH